MKLYLACLTLLLVSLGKCDISNVRIKNPDLKLLRLVICSLATASPSPPGLVSKVLFSDYHFILEGFDVDKFFYQSVTDERTRTRFLEFQTTEFDTSIGNSKFVSLYRNLTDRLGPASGFALETYPLAPGHRPDEKLCLQRTSAHLRQLIIRCFANMALRDLTQTEKQQLEGLKRQSNGKLVFAFGLMNSN